MTKLVPRKFERNRCSVQAVVRPQAGGSSLRVEVLNLGQGGLASSASRGLPMGAAVEVVFSVSQAAVEAGLDKREGRVVDNRILRSGNLLRIAFIRPLEAAELELLQASWVRA
jgi:hypothetical protein